ncbi:hypothetical protein F0562_028929 [Nyssa sinensis]|uniref:Glycosyltransferase n=1 Tax=Nyssa sinensis TaxID=561372 RepID=A0A5J5B5N0_9ASTE|nr:hypothetical protein F0562_028929 [Nyssa sinensis]
MGCLDWLDKREPGSVVYVNYGSLIVMTPQQLREFAWGLANSKYAFLWVIRPDLVNGGTEIISKDYVEEIEDRGLILDWCPQERVLQHPAVGGFLTHCGWNSTLESICEGVPMICWPFFAEQQTNCFYLCNKWGVGMEIDTDARREKVEGLVRELMEGEKGKEMREKAMEWRKRADSATKPGGPDSLKGFDDFQFETISDGLPQNNQGGIGDIPALCLSMPIDGLKSFRELIIKLNASPNLPPVTCIVSDGVMSYMLKVVEEFGITGILFFTRSACEERVLHHPAVGGFLTHCGWNSTLESICEGVPMICWPFFAEQQTNCFDLCNKWGVGMEIDTDVRREQVEGLVRELMKGEKGKEMREMVTEWKKRAEAATKPGGSSYINFDMLVKHLKQEPVSNEALYPRKCEIHFMVNLS